MGNETISNKENNLSLIDSMITAMFLPKEYGKLLKLSNKKIVRYIAVVVLLVCIIQYAVLGLGSIAGLGGMKGIIMDEIPQFSLQDGKFYLEEKIEKRDEVSGIYFLVDTSEKKFTRDDIPQGMLQAVLVSEGNMLVYNSIGGLGGMVENQSFDEFKDIVINNETIAGMSGFIYIALFFFFLLLYFAAIVDYLFYALVYAGFTYFIFKPIMVDLKFGDVYKITLFAQTIGKIVVAITYCLGIELLYMAGSIFSVMSTIILMNKAIHQFHITKEY